MSVSGDYHYLACGLPNVRLFGYSPKDGATEEERFENINVLHQTIAEAVARSRGPLTSNEVKFLRTELGLTCPELADRIDVSASTAYKAEHGESELGMHSDIELRRLIFTHFEIDMPPLDELHARYLTVRPATHLIRIASDNFGTLWKLAA